jgi:hypothetical protein
VSRASQLFDQLLSANIKDSTIPPSVLRWLEDASGPYTRIAESCLALLGDRKLKQIASIDVIVPYYAQALGLRDETEIPDGAEVDREKLKQAIVTAYNENNGTHATSFEDIVRR